MNLLKRLFGAKSEPSVIKFKLLGVYANGEGRGAKIIMIDGDTQHTMELEVNEMITVEIK